jgi:hypothetical protein
MRARTLLGRFLADRRRRHTEPSRQGVKKGEPIGFSRTKFAVLTLHLYDLDLTAMTRTTGVSYPMITKWRANPDFWDAAEQLANSFVKGTLVPFLDRQHTTAAAQMVELADALSIDDVRHGKSYEYADLIESTELRDLPLWGTPLRDAVVETARPFEIDMATEVSPEIRRALTDLMLRMGPPGDPVRRRRREAAYGLTTAAGQATHVMAWALDLLAAEKPPAEERRCLAVLLGQAKINLHGWAREMASVLQSDLK